MHTQTRHKHSCWRFIKGTTPEEQLLKQHFFSYVTSYSSSDIYFNTKNSWNFFLFSQFPVLHLNWHLGAAVTEEKENTVLLQWSWNGTNQGILFLLQLNRIIFSLLCKQRGFSHKGHKTKRLQWRYHLYIYWQVLA